MIIYKITNLINNKIYIGQTKNSLEKRLSGHISDSKRFDTRLCNAIAKYGSENFIIKEVISGNFNRELTDELEKHYIRLHGSKLRNIGYNIKDGGNSVPMSNETKQKISKAHKGRKISESQLVIRRMKHSERYSIEKQLELKEKYKFATLKSKEACSIKVRNKETGQIFSSIIEASKAFNIKRITLSWQLRNNKCKNFEYLK